MNSKIRKMMNKRYRALIKAQISRVPAYWSVYRRLRNDVIKELRMAAWADPGFQKWGWMADHIY